MINFTSNIINLLGKKGKKKLNHPFFIDDNSQIKLQYPCFK